MPAARLDGFWIEEKLNELARATSRGGEIWRAAYTEEDAVAHDMLEAMMASAGLSTQRDAVGNLYGRLEGSESGTILTGSHLDTVRNGGKYDGVAGIVAAIAALRNIAERPETKGRVPLHSVEVVGFMEEDGSRYPSSYIGSKALIGRLSHLALEERDEIGISMEEAMRAAGYAPDRIEEARRNDIKAFVELHIEQGPVLEASGKKIGLVESIVGIICWTIRIKGVQNHAGTTPMNMRSDPLLPTCALIERMREFTTSVSETATITVGRIQALPGTPNVIPGEIVFTIDMRDADWGALMHINDFLTSELDYLEYGGYNVVREKNFWEKPLRLNMALTNKLEEATNRARLTPMRMNSGAAHDSQVIGEFIPSCMLFIPSKGGISHSPFEYTSPEDLDCGLRVLEEALISLAWG